MFLHSPYRKVEIHGDFHIAHMSVAAHLEYDLPLRRKCIDIFPQQNICLCESEPVVQYIEMRDRLILRRDGNILRTA